MKKSSHFRPLFLLIFLTLYTSSFGQSRSQIELNGELSQLEQRIHDLKGQIQKIDTCKESFTSSLVFCHDELSGIRTIYTKPVRCFNAPVIQMIAVQSNMDSNILYQLRIELFSREASVNLNRIHIRSLSKIFEFKLKNYDQQRNPGNYGVLLSRCWSDRNVSGFEGYIYTFQLTLSEDDFFNIISSKWMKVGFETMLIPEKEVALIDICKMNELYEFIRVSRDEDSLNLQLKDATNRYQEIKKLLNYL